MPPENQQLPPTGEGPDLSQLSPAALAGPDSLRLSTSLPTQGSPPRDWEESFKGLMKRYNEDRTQWDNDRRQWTDGFKNLESKLLQFEDKIKVEPTKPQPKPVTTPTASATPETPLSDEASELYDKVLELEAKQKRDSLLFQYMQPGQPGYGLPLYTFRDNIPAIVDEDAVDDKEQRQAIENFINSLKGVQGSTQQTTQQAMLSGWTPGASPGVPLQPTKEALEAEYYKLKELYGSADFDKKSPDEQTQIQARYYQLHDQIGKNLPGQTTPWMSSQEVGNTVQQLLAKVGVLEGLFLKK